MTTAAKVRSTPAQKPGRSVQEVGTPRALLDAVEARFGKLAWDLAADESNHVTTGWSGPGSARQPDSLAGAWWALPPGLLWLNPPFADIADWAEKCARWRDIDAGSAMQQRIAFLVPASVGTNWFAEHVNGRALVLFLRPRLTFVGHVDPYPKDLMLAVYGEHPCFECWKWNEAPKKRRGVRVVVGPVSRSHRTGAPISKSVRFEVFKRDEFTCRYCGRSTPDVTLHVDHVLALANGGTDEMDNLVTSCVECNLGKSDVPLHHVRGRNDGRFSARDRIFYIRGIIRNRFPGCDQERVLEMLRKAWNIGFDLEKLETMALMAPTLPTILGRLYAAFADHLEGIKR